MNNKYKNHLAKSITFITGSARSGKSSYALSLAEKQKKDVVFLATATAFDQEMKIRIKNHQNERPSTWKTIEEPIDIDIALQKISKNTCVILDCLTLWLSNMYLVEMEKTKRTQKMEYFLNTLSDIASSIIIVSNEVGWGIVPENKIAREYRDELGSLHQSIAILSNEVILMVAGLPVTIKQDAAKKIRSKKN